MQSGVRTHAVRLTISQLLDITADASSLRNRGSVLGLFDEVGVFVDGEDRFLADPRSLRALNEAFSVSALPHTRQVDLTAAATALTLTETIEIPMAYPRGAKPEETAFLERDIRQEMQVFVKYNGNAAKVVGGGTVGALAAPTIRVTQLYDSLRAELPLLRPAMRQIVRSVSAANTQEEIHIRGARYIGAIVIQQDSDIGEVSDIINSIALYGDEGRAIIPQPLNLAAAVGQAAFDAGGDLSSRSYFVLNFIRSGRLSHLLHPGAYNNLRLVLDVQPSVTAGATNSRVRVTLYEFDRDTELTSAELPFII